MAMKQGVECTLIAARGAGKACEGLDGALGEECALSYRVEEKIYGNSYHCYHYDGSDK